MLRSLRSGRAAAALALAATLLGWLALAAPLAQAQQPYPNKPVRIIVPLPPGNTSESTARVLARQLQLLTGQPFIVDNKPGGNNVIAVRSMQSAPADGYTLFFGSNASMAANVPSFKNLGYDPAEDFTPIALSIKARWMLAVSTSSPWNTIEDLVAAGRKDPALLSAGVGSSAYQMAAALFAQAAGIKVNLIPYNGTPPAMADTVGGQVSFVVADAGSLKGLIGSSKLRPLAVFGDERSALAPNVPSLNERGFGSIQLYSWAGLYAPTRTPHAIVARLAELMAEAVKKDEYLKFIAENAGELATQSQDELARFQKSQVEKYREAMAVAGLEPQ